MISPEIDLIDAMSDILKESSAQSPAFLFFDRLAIGKPSSVIKFDGRIIRALEANDKSSVLAAGVLGKLGIDKVTKSVLCYCTIDRLN